MKRKEYLLRSILFVPTYKEKFIQKAIHTGADALILDLEDSVPEVYKQKGREIIKKYIDKGVFKNLQVFVRLNPIESKILLKDLKYVLHEDIDGFMLTKIRTAEDMIYYDKLITQLEIDKNIEAGHFTFMPLIETTLAIMNAYHIASASDRTIALTFGGEDFLNDLEGLHGNPPRCFDYPRAYIALAARAAGIKAIDTPYLAVNDTKGFIKEESVSFEMGFSGCLLLHPKQIALANQCFVPSPEEVQKSREIIKSIEEANKRGSGVAMLENKMIGPPMKKRAEKVLRIIELIEQKVKLEVMHEER
ncbi:HpcH/HpaI aldolase/citrate lyase family protein [Crassaminicella indica]|uniref:CoA ester lyase n=1 Tax=Crassaminicella indica TaxID=2855394 RepID=A0ABX8RDH8_9CLOT|nr:CoA ester lyase [Crassaminicella indica]QXM05960.1 CoA ester lyase [Crassaminicella indica]